MRFQFSTLRITFRACLIHHRTYSYNMAAPGNLLRFDVKAADLSPMTDALIKSSRAVYDRVGALSADNVTYESVVKAIADDICDYGRQNNNIDFFQSVSPDKEMRDASVAAAKTLADYDVEKGMRKDVFDKVVLANEKLGSTLSPEAKRFLERLIKLGKRNGLHLSDAIQAEIKELLKEISKHCIDYSNNLDEENTKLEFTEKDLDGLPADFIKSLTKKDNGTLEVSLKYPHYIPCMQFAKNPETRKKLEIAFNQRCIKENTKLLETVIELRHKKAQLLGYKTHADFILDMRMAKTEPTVSKFLSELAVKLQPLRKQEVETFMEYKKKDCADLGVEFDGKLNMWDLKFYMTRLEEKKYSIDKNKLKEYFPMETVTEGLLQIYQELLGVKYEKVENPDVWHEEVLLYNVKDADSSELLGYFYMDMHPRDGKFGHAACFPLQAGCVSPSGGRQLPVASMVCNFTKPTADQPSLLTHEEVETYFHEFGHTMHHICSTADFSLFSGTSVERDFVEAPSQMLENWVWFEEPLSRMSKHYKDGTKIPSDLLNSLINSRKANAGVFNLRQILLATFDQTIHKMQKVDTAAVFSQISQETLGITSTPNTNMAASFGHLMGGYDSQYYGYMWSEVYSADMFASRFKAEGIMNPKVGKDYRKYILSPGGSKDATEMLRNFLGREPVQEPFLASKGLNV